MKNLSAKILAFLLIIFLNIGASCQTPKVNSQQTQSLSNTNWELTNINNRQVITSSMGEGVSITFEPTENRISGFAGCNRFFGNYRFDESGNLTFDAIGSTKKMCNNISVETEFLNMLQKVNRYENDDRTLKLLQQTTVLATFTKTPFRK